MKIMIIGDKGRYAKHTKADYIPAGAELVFCSRGVSDDELLACGGDAQILLADAIAPVSRYLIAHMPNLKMIHSEGVGYEGVDIAAAAERGIFVCNNKGSNSRAVAEQAILLMLALLRSTVVGHQQVREGLQIQAKEAAMVNGVTELGDCKVGLIGFGDIGRETAHRLQAFGCEVYYYDIFRRSPEEEKALNVGYLGLAQLASVCDIVSIHTAVTKDTAGMINKEFLSNMKKTAFIVNTARGEIVDNLALREALVNGDIAGAGLDTIYPEPTTKDNPLVDLPEAHCHKVTYSPHLGGITTGSLRRCHEHMWKNVRRVAAGERPDNIVNGL